MKFKKKIIVNVLVMVAIIGYAFISISNLSRDLKAEKTIRLKNSIENASITCFSIEGFYPSDVKYLIDNYNIVYDKEEYHIFYETKGANFKSRVEVIERSVYEKK